MIRELTVPVWHRYHWPHLTRCGEVLGAVSRRRMNRRKIRLWLNWLKSPPASSKSTGFLLFLRSMALLRRAYDKKLLRLEHLRCELSNNFHCFDVPQCSGFLQARFRKRWQSTRSHLDDFRASPRRNNPSASLQWCWAQKWVELGLRSVLVHTSRNPPFRFCEEVGDNDPTTKDFKKYVAHCMTEDGEGAPPMHDTWFSLAVQS